MASVETAETNADRFAHVLGLAALDLWSELPRELQQALFERAGRIAGSYKPMGAS